MKKSIGVDAPNSYENDEKLVIFYDIEDGDGPEKFEFGIVNMDELPSDGYPEWERGSSTITPDHDAVEIYDFAEHVNALSDRSFLSARESEVLLLKHCGLDRRLTADLLEIGLNTVTTHRESIKNKDQKARYTTENIRLHR